MTRFANRDRRPDWLLRKNRLPNGNIEAEYKAGRRLLCRVYYEVDEAAGAIVGWRSRRDSAGLHHSAQLTRTRGDSAAPESAF
jgi:hypothetical protein